MLFRSMVNPRKIYPIDPGFIPVFDRSGELNIGHALETCVLIELDRRGAEVSYIRSASGTEVDFLAHYPGGRQELIQVCSSLEDQATAERKARGLEDAAAGHPKADLVLITLTSGKAHSIPANIRLVPVVSWLLSDGRAAGNP